jgi:hypothetical protein
VYPFGDARNLGVYKPGPCDGVVNIFANPADAGYRLVTDAGATIPFGAAPAGGGMSGTQRWCVSQTTCPGHFNTMADYQKALDTRGPIWESGDNAPIVDLGDGRRIWMFGDTYTGPADATTVLPGYGFVRNTIAIQQHGCMEFRTGGPDVFHTDDYVLPPSPKEWYWLVDGVVDRGAGIVYLSALRVTTDTGMSGFKWQIVGSTLVALDIHSLAVRFTRDMKTVGGLFWGTSMMQSGSWIYIYARGGNEPNQYAARTTTSHLLDGQWQFWNGAAWSTTPTVKPMKFLTYDGAPDPGPLSAITVDPYGSGFLASTKRCDILCDDLTAWYARKPGGPWYAVNENYGQVLTTTRRYPSQIVYSGHLMPTSHGWLGVWTTNRGYYTMLKYMYGILFGMPHDLPTADQLAARFSKPLPHVARSHRAPPPAPKLVEVPIDNGRDIPTTGGWARH